MQGWNIAFKDTVPDLSGEEMEKRIQTKLGGDTWFLDGATWQSITTLPRPVRKIVEAEKHILSVDNPRFIHGTGLKAGKTWLADAVAAAAPLCLGSEQFAWGDWFQCWCLNMCKGMHELTMGNNGNVQASAFVGFPSIEFDVTVKTAAAGRWCVYYSSYLFCAFKAGRRILLSCSE
jgi:hypothetical protein